MSTVFFQELPRAEKFKTPLGNSRTQTARAILAHVFFLNLPPKRPFVFPLLVLLAPGLARLPLTGLRAHGKASKTLPRRKVVRNFENVDFRSWEVRNRPRDHDFRNLRDKL